MTQPEKAAGEITTQVVVVGAGPVGLLLAAELARAGVSVVVVERLATPMTESRASQLTTRTAEVLHERGYDSLVAEAVRELRSHFGGLPLDLSGLPSAFAGNWKVPQYRTEAVLGDAAEKLGASLRRAHALTDVTASTDAVVCEVEGPTGSLRIRAQYLVGCDGVESTVRRLCGFDVARAAATKELIRADVTGIDVPDRRFERLDRGLAVAATRGGVTRVMAYEFGHRPVRRFGPPGFPEVARRWERITGEDISGGTPIWLDSFDNSRGLATCYRRGRVLLAGDAAHWHMPIGGQALNVGLQDAVNLGWKLAASVLGWAPPGLLDSYHRERHAVAARVIESVLAQETLLLGGPEVEPLRAVLSELLALDQAHDQLAQAAAGLDVQYEAGDHPLIGRHLPNVELRNELGAVALAELLADSDGVILTAANPARAGAGLAAETLARTNGCHVRMAHAAPVGVDVFAGADTILVRPDGYVAWAGDDPAGLRAALARWFGASVDRP